MREIAALILLIVLISFGWKQAYRDQVGSLFPQLGIKPSRLAQLAAAAVQARRAEAEAVRAEASQATQAAQRDNSWMWRRGTLDTQNRDGRYGR
jgi:hypothetical protein